MIAFCGKGSSSGIGGGNTPSLPFVRKQQSIAGRRQVQNTGFFFIILKRTLSQRKILPVAGSQHPVRFCWGWISGCLL
jgi:hypothetical protein